MLRGLGLPIGRLRATQKLVMIFVGMVLLPGLLLGVFGFRALVQEKRRIEQRISEDLRATADAIGLRLEGEVAAWRRVVDEPEPRGAVDPASWPETFRKASSEPGSLVVLLREGGRIRATPATQVLYRLSPVPEPSAGKPPGPALAEAESAELRANDYSRAIDMYREVSAPPGSTERAGVLLRLARTLKKAGRTGDALRTFRLLEKEPDTIVDSLPSQLVAGFEALVLALRMDACATCPGEVMRLYSDLVGGRWQLEKASYVFYSEQLRQMLPRSAEAERLREIEHRKLALSRAAESYLDHPRPIVDTEGGYWIAISRSNGTAAVILGEPFLRSRIWPAVFQHAGNVSFSLLTRDRRVLFGDAPGPREAPRAETALGTEPSLRLEVWPRNPMAGYAGFQLQQNLNAGTLGFVLLLLAFGAYLTVRTVRAELRMAQIKSGFVAAVSHEFRSPLAGINQLGEILRDERVADDGRRQSYYELIVAETRRLRRLVENVLDFSRIQEDRTSYRFEPFQPSPWLREIVEEVASAVNGAGVQIQARIPEELPRIVGDREALSTAVHNLLDNAVKYSGESKIVELEAAASGAKLAISVRDHGVGIGEQDKPHVFERFYRGGEGREEGERRRPRAQSRKAHRFRAWRDRGLREPQGRGQRVHHPPRQGALTQCRASFWSKTNRPLRSVCATISSWKATQSS